MADDIFDPGDYVTVAVFGLNYPGRVTEVRLRIGATAYLVEYVAEGVFNQREFYGDELQAAQLD